MAMPVDDPAAIAVIEWIRPEAGGNRIGPPDWPVAVEIVFPWEEMRHYHPEHIDMNWGTTVIIDPIDLITAYVWESKLDFIARRAVLPLLEADRQVAIHRGGRQIVAVSRIKEVLGPADASQPSPLSRPGQPPVSPPDQTREVIAAATINWLSPETGGLDHPPTTGSFTVIASFFGGGPDTMLYSLAGGTASFLSMALLKKYTGLSVIGISAAGGFLHNIAQLLVAAAVMETTALFSYAPVLGVIGILTGVCIGTTARFVLQKVPG